MTFLWVCVTLLGAIGLVAGIGRLLATVGRRDEPLNIRLPTDKFDREINAQHPRFQNRFPFQAR